MNDPAPASEAMANDTFDPWGIRDMLANALLAFAKEQRLRSRRRSIAGPDAVTARALYRLAAEKADRIRNLLLTADALVTCGNIFTLLRDFERLQESAVTCQR